MANVISLHTRQVFLAAGSPAAYGKASFYLNGTLTAVNVYSDTSLTVLRPQPVDLDAEGVMPPCYIGTSDPLRILITDENDVPLAGYPMDNITPLTADNVGADTVSFNPTEAIPASNVQVAIETVAGLFTDQTALLSRMLTPYLTGGSSNTYTITPDPAITAYGAGQAFLVRPNRANTGAAFLNVNGLGARAWQKMGPSGVPVDFAAGEIRAYQEVLVVDDGTRLLAVLGRDGPLSGNNENGSWLRIPTRPNAGLQFCWMFSFLNFEGSGVAPGDFQSGTWTFPRPFQVTPVTWTNARSSTANEAVEHLASSSKGLTTTTAYVVAYNRHPTSSPSGLQQIDAIAFGSYSDA